MKQLYERGQGLVCVSFAMVTVVKRVSRRKKFISLLLALVMALSLVACGSKNNTDDTQNTTPDDAQTPAETVELTVFAAASLTESLTAIGEKYMAENENVKISFNFDSSGKLYTQITEGTVDCGIIYASDAYSAGLTVAAFARTLGEYGATSMVAGYTPGKTATVSTTVYQLWQINNDALAMKWVMVNMAISDEAVCLPEGPYSAVVQRVVRDLHATVVLLRPVNGGEEVMLRAILPEGAAAAAGETVRFDLLAEKCLCCG